MLPAPSPAAVIVPASQPEPADVDDGQELVLEELTREQVLGWRTRAAADHQIVHDHIARYGELLAQRLFTRAFVAPGAAPVPSRSAAGATLRERWAAIVPEFAGHVAAVSYAPDSGRLTVCLDSAAWAAKARLVQSAANKAAGCTVHAWESSQSAAVHFVRGRPWRSANEVKQNGLIT